MNGIIPMKIVSDLMKGAEIISDDRISEITDFYKNCGRESFYSFAKKKKLLPYFAHTLCELGIDSEYWKSIHDEYEARNNSVFELLKKVFDEFEAIGLNEIAVAENFGSILLSGACLGCFCSGDIDFYCGNTDMDRLDSVMTKFGFIWSDRHKRKKSFAREYVKKDCFDTSINNGEFWLNFQLKPMTRKKTHLYDQRYILKRYYSLFKNTVKIAGTNIRVFNGEDGLYLNCVHIASGHYYILSPGIRLYKDIDLPVTKCEIDWERFNTYIKEDKIGIRSDVVLFLSQLLLGTKMPDTAFTPKKNTKRFNSFVNSIINTETLEFKLPPKGLFHYLHFLIYVELTSDGTNVFLSLLERLWVLLVDWN